MISIGLDLSLTNTGVSVIKDSVIECHNIVAPKSKGPKTLSEEFQRIDFVVGKIFAVCENNHKMDIIVIEAPSMASRVGKIHERAGLWWSVYGLVSGNYDAKIYRVPPTSLKKYITRNGQAKKDEVITAVNRIYNLSLKDDNIADATVLAAMGARLLGSPIELDYAVEIACINQMEE